MPFDAAKKPDDFFHFSQVQTFLKCRHRHDLAYIERLEPRERNNRMDFGTFGHAELADLWLGKKEHFPKALNKALAQSAPSKQQEVHEAAQTAQKVARKAFAELEKRFRVVYLESGPWAPEDWAPLIEHSLLVDVEGVKFGGTPDAVLEDVQDGSIWIVDWKFRQSFLPAESELLNLQMLVYSKLLQNYGITVSGTRQIQIKPSLPKEPKVTKEGAISRQAITTDWETYAKAVTKAGLDLADYEDMKVKLADTVFVDVDTCKTLRSQQEVDFFWDREVVPAIREILARKVPGPGRCFDPMQCRGCSYRELCVEEAKGGDLEYLKSTLFRRKGEDDELSTAVVMEDE